MKKYMLIATCFALSCGLSVVNANNASPTEKSEIKIVDDLKIVDSNSLIFTNNYDFGNDVSILENDYISFNEEKQVNEYKMGALKNKVNIFHLFYKNKV